LGNGGCISPPIGGANSTPQIPQLDLKGQFKVRKEVREGREGNGEVRKGTGENTVPSPAPEINLCLWPC